MYQIGQQIAYIPPHAKGDVNHPDTIFGFVYSLAFDTAEVFCRFWNKSIFSSYDNFNGLSSYIKYLRTRNNSEKCKTEYIKQFDCFPQKYIDDLVSFLNTEENT